MTFSNKYTISNTLLNNIKDVVRVSVELNSKRLSSEVYSEVLKKSRKGKDDKYVKALDKFSKKNTDFNPNLIVSIHSFLVEGGGQYKDSQSKKFLKPLIKYVSSIRKDTDPVITAGLFYKHFSSIMPFESANQDVRNIATRVLLMDLDINVLGLFDLENIGDVKTKDNTKWLEYFSSAVLKEMKRVSKELEGISFKPGQGLNEDQKKILKYLEKHSVITDSDYSKLTERKKATRVLDFNRLMNENLIERRGKGRQTHYILK